MYPIALAIIMLIRRYTLADLGFRLNGFPAAIAAFAVTGIMALLVAPHNFTWHMVLEESGGSIRAVLFTGFVVKDGTEKLCAASQSTLTELSNKADH